jgi:hypothetical protein
MNIKDKKIYCIDEREDGKSLKRWSSLDTRIVVFDDKKIIEDDKLNKALLLIIHKSATDEEFISKYLRNTEHILPYVLLVSTDALDGKTIDNGKIHNSSIRLPNNSDLYKLSSKFTRLVESLHKISTDIHDLSAAKEREAAWHNWEMCNSDQILTALYILCQGYLLIDKSEIKYSDWWRSIFESSLNDLDEKLNMSQRTKKLINRIRLFWVENNKNEYDFLPIEVLIKQILCGNGSISIEVVEAAHEKIRLLYKQL